MSFNDKCLCESQETEHENTDSKQDQIVCCFEKINGEYCNVSYTLNECNTCKKYTIITKKTVERANMTEIYKQMQNDLATKMKYISQK